TIGRSSASPTSPSSTGTVTGCPSASTSSRRSVWRRLAWSHGTCTRIAIPNGVGSGPVSDQPPPTTVSLPSATCAKSARSMVTFTRALLHTARPGDGLHGRPAAHSLGSVGQRFTEARRREMLKKLFLAVLSFWLLKKYVLPYFDGSRDEVAGDEG